MKFSIIIESHLDIERILPLLGKIHFKQKEGMYIFYRIVSICKSSEGKDFKKCMRFYKIKAPFSSWVKDEDGDIHQKETLPHFFEEELFRNPVEMILLLGQTPIAQQCNEIAKKYKIKVALLDNQETNSELQFTTDLRFSYRNDNDYDQFIQEIVTLYKL